MNSGYCIHNYEMSIPRKINRWVGFFLGFLLCTLFNPNNSIVSCQIDYKRGIPIFVRVNVDLCGCAYD